MIFEIVSKEFLDFTIKVRKQVLIQFVLRKI